MSRNKPRWRVIRGIAYKTSRLGLAIGLKYRLIITAYRVKCVVFPHYRFRRASNMYDAADDHPTTFGPSNCCDVSVFAAKVGRSLNAARGGASTMTSLRQSQIDAIYGVPNCWCGILHWGRLRKYRRLEVSKVYRRCIARKIHIETKKPNPVFDTAHR